MSHPIQLAFLGAGNMARAIIEGVISAGTYRCDQITASDLRSDATASLAKAHGIKQSRTNADAVAGADVVVLCVKPQTFPVLLADIAPCLRNGTLVISIAAGVPIAVIEAGLGSGVPVIRVMPNTPALVQAGATALAAGRHATAQDLEIADAIFSAVGITVRVEEASLDAVTGLSGSGPAYVFKMVESLIAGGQRAGLDAEQARTLAIHTVAGAAKLLVQSGEDPAELRRKVTSPGGTTAAGLATLDAAGFGEAVEACVLAATERGRQLGDEARRAID